MRLPKQMAFEREVGWRDPSWEGVVESGWRRASCVPHRFKRDLHYNIGRIPCRSELLTTWKNLRPGCKCRRLSPNAGRNCST